MKLYAIKYFPMIRKYQVEISLLKIKRIKYSGILKSKQECMYVTVINKEKKINQILYLWMKQKTRKLPEHQSETKKTVEH